MLSEGLGKKRLLKEVEATDLISVLSKVTQHYGAPITPPVPSPLRPYALLNTSLYEDSLPHSLSYWATDQFTRLKQECGMENWSIQIRPIQSQNQDSNLHKTSFTPVNRATDKATALHSFWVDKFGRPVIPYSEADCRKPGAFAAHMLVRLSEIRLMALNLPVQIDPAKKAARILATAAFSGQGFTLLSVAEQLPNILTEGTKKPLLSVKKSQNILIFSTCLGLLCQSRSPEYVIASYGCILPASLRKRIRRACAHLKDFEAEISILKLYLNESRRRSHRLSVHKKAV